jgi:hypothetical protein
LTVNANGIVQLKGNSTALGWYTIRVTTLNINGGLVEAVSSYQHLWDTTVNFSGGGKFWYGVNKSAFLGAALIGLAIIAITVSM